MEIERKFLVRQMPEKLEQHKRKEIEQAYLCEEGIILRVRKSNERYVLTYKAKQKSKVDCLVNIEEEYEIPECAYLHLAKKADGNRIRKTRYCIPIAKELIAELDEFHGNKEGLVIVEVEFPDEEMADNFEKPDWFGEEVTNDGKYRNANMIWD